MYTPQFVKLQFLDSHLLHLTPAQIAHHHQSPRDIFMLIFIVQLLKLHSSADHHGIFDAYPTICYASIF